MDIVRNRSYPEDPPFAMFPSHWVALALRSNTVVRGVHIAAKLKEEVSFFIDNCGFSGNFTGTRSLIYIRFTFMN